MKTHLFFSDSHAHYEQNNKRAEWLGELINDVRPDVLIDGGDTADLPSLASYDKGTRAAVGRTYSKDIEAHNDFQDKLFTTIRRGKRKLPRRVRLIGNHEQRIDRALDANPQLQGTVSYGDLLLSDYYQDVVHYNGNTPGVINVDGVSYSHYFTSGNMGRAVSGEHPAYTLIAKKHVSCAQGHSHIFDFAMRTKQDGERIMSLIAPAFIDYNVSWAGEMQKMWTNGVSILKNVEDGVYDYSYVSLDTLKKTYGK